MTTASADRKRLGQFFVLAFAISWLVWSLSPWLSGGDRRLQQVIDSFGAYGPALAGLLLTERRGQKGVPAICPRALVLSFLVCFGLGLLALEFFFEIAYSASSLIAILLLALAAATTLAAAFGSMGKVDGYLGSLVDWRLPVRWYLYAVSIPPIAYLVGLCVSHLLGQAPELVTPDGSVIGHGGKLIISLFTVTLFGGSLNEEPGWRGFALPRLLDKLSPTRASLILGVAWTVWHAPLHFNGFYGNSGLIGLVARFVWNVPLSFLFTWLFLRTSGNLLLAVLLHTAVNGSTLFIRLPAWCRLSASCC